MARRNYIYLFMALIVIVIVVLILLRAFIAEDKELKLSIIDKEYPLIFQDESLSLETRKDIIEDIELNLSYTKEIIFKKIPQESKILRKEYGPRVTHSYDTKQRNIFPVVMKGHFRGAAKIGNEYHIIIHKKLSDVYKKAFEFKKQDPIMFEKLDEFLHFISDRKNIENIAKDRESAKSLFFFYYDEDYENYAYEKEVLGIAGMQVRRPSILDFRIMKYKGNEIVVFNTVVKSREGAKDKFFMKEFPHFVYIDDKWHVGIPRLP